jgi:hypothetical protein
MIAMYLTKKRIKKNFIFSSIFGGIFFLNLFSNFKSYNTLFYSLLFIITIVVAVYEKKIAYLIVSQEGIELNGLFLKKYLFWKDVQSFKDFAGDIKIVGLSKSITIPKANLDQSDLEILQNILKEKFNS